MLEDLPYEDIGIRPDWRQLLIDELLSILLAVGLLIVGGLDSVPYHSVLFCIALALAFKVYYRLVYLRTMHYTITGYSPGAGTTSSSTASWTSMRSAASCNSS